LFVWLLKCVDIGVGVNAMLCCTADDVLKPEGSEFTEGQSFVPVDNDGTSNACRTLTELYARYRYNLGDPHYHALLKYSTISLRCCPPLFHEDVCILLLCCLASRSTATFVIWDDHEVKDDWGMDLMRSIDAEYLRVTEPLNLYRRSNEKLSSFAYLCYGSDLCNIFEGNGYRLCGRGRGEQEEGGGQEMETSTFSVDDFMGDRPSFFLAVRLSPSYRPFPHPLFLSMVAPCRWHVKHF